MKIQISRYTNIRSLIANMKNEKLFSGYLLGAIAFSVCFSIFSCGNNVNTETNIDSSMGNDQQVNGTWKLIKYIENGKPNEEEIKQNYIVVRKKGTQVIYKNGIEYSKRMYVINPEKNPKEISFIRDDGTRVLGVYEINGNEMRIAIFSDEAKSKTDYPGDFQEDGKIIAVYERLK